MGAKEYQRRINGGNRGSDISVTGVPLFAAPPCTVGTQGWLDEWLCLDHSQARRRPSARFEVAMQSDFQEKFSYTKAVRGLLCGGSVMARYTSTSSDQVLASSLLARNAQGI